MERMADPHGNEIHDKAYCLPTVGVGVCRLLYINGCPRGRRPRLGGVEAQYQTRAHRRSRVWATWTAREFVVEHAKSRYVARYQRALHPLSRQPDVFAHALGNHDGSSSAQKWCDPHDSRTRTDDARCGYAAAGAKDRRVPNRNFW